MRIFRYAICALMLVPFFSLSSCKKDDDDADDKLYLNGTLSIEVPAFLKYGDVVHVIPTGVYRNDESDTLLFYSWKNPITGKLDTLRKEGDDESAGKEFDFEVTVDTTCSYSLTAYCWADGYYTKSATASFTVVHPGYGKKGSLQGYDFLDKLQSYTDPRDGKQYYYNTIDGKDWMIRNLSYAGAGESYRYAEAADEMFGRFYTWDEAQTACPSGWHTASDAEFTALCHAAGASSPSEAHADIPDVAGALLGDISFNGSSMWDFSPDVRITNNVYFTALPVGYAINADKSYFRDMNNRAVFWTSDEKDSDMAWARCLNQGNTVFYATEFGKSSVRASVRCVR